jgi:choline dehydrogenase-like flavoprotein
MIASATEMLEATGAPRAWRGTRAAASSTVWNQAWDVPNLFLTDGACMARRANQNPSITDMALTPRACHHAGDLMKRNER